jgi:Tol biopolymer transport system component
MKGSRFPSEARSFTDRTTGATVWQMTAAAAISHPSYFLQSAFLPDGKSMFFVSFRSGAAQLYLAELPSGEITQLTAGEPLHAFSPALHPNREEIVFVRGGSIWAIRLDTLEERLIAEHRNAQLGEPSIGADGDWIAAAAKIDGRNGIVVGRDTGADWRFIQFPRTVIHPQFHPLEPEWIEFAADPAPRMFRMRRDGSSLECLYEHGNEEFVVHETFLGQTGDLVFTIWPRALCRMDWTTRDIRTISEYNAWHIAPDRAGRRVLCDTNHPDNGIQIIDVATGGRRQLCLSESSNAGSQWRTSRYAMPEDFAAARSEGALGKSLSWMEAGTDTVYGPQWTHPHPSWSHDETRVAFASDRTGITQVYVAEL